MPTVAHIDTIETLSMTEKAGSITQVIRQIIVSGLTGVSWGKMYNALATAGVPVYGERLDSGLGANLNVSERTVKMLDRDTSAVTVTYDIKEINKSLLVDNDGGKSIAGKMTASVVQVDTNMYRVDGLGEKKTVTVEHTYPNDDPDFAGDTIKQAGQFKVFVPQMTFTCEGVMSTTRPWNIVDSICGCVNAAPWMGGGAREWMCTEVTWDPQSRSKYFMTFAFQRNEDTWDPTVVFIDSRTNRPPKDLVKDTGYKTIKYHRAVNFMSHIGFKIAGA